MPNRVAVELSHAVVQAIAEDEGFSVLHIKGPAVDPELLDVASLMDADGVVRITSVARNSADADVLVHPDQAFALQAAMLRHGWHLEVDFADGSAFEHAATMSHPSLAYVDIHRFFPGMNGHPVQAFRALWDHRRSLDIAGIPCTVPDITAQRLILILNAVRGGPLKRHEVDRLLAGCAADEQGAVADLAVVVGAEVALAAATGNLQEYSNYREHDLWELISTGNGSFLALWRARVRAQPHIGPALREAVRLVLPNSRRLAFQLGRQLTRREVAAAWIARFRQGFRAIVDLVLRPTRNGAG